MLTNPTWRKSTYRISHPSFQFTRSQHVANVLAFHPKATSKLMTLPVFRNGGLILQDLASCFPAAVLDPSKWTYDQVDALDATSAPGNKTSHLSALMKGTGSLTALELAPNRFRTLVKMLGRAGCLKTNGGNVQPKNEDFLKIEPSTIVRCILLDPSCSGSGIVNRLDYLMSQDDEQDNLEQVVPGDGQPDPNSLRLSNLAALQLRMIRHAMSFPSLERFTYSTCSIYEEENEQVVLAALSSVEAKEGGWALAPRDEVLPSWSERGRLEACNGNQDVAESLVRCTPGGLKECDEGTVHVEATNGFFVCCFVRNIPTTKRKAKESEQKKKRTRH